VLSPARGRVLMARIVRDGGPHLSRRARRRRLWCGKTATVCRLDSRAPVRCAQRQ